MYLGFWVGINSSFTILAPRCTDVINPGLNTNLLIVIFLDILYGYQSIHNISIYSIYKRHIVLYTYIQGVYHKLSLSIDFRPEKHFNRIAQKGMTFDHVFAIHSPFLLPSFFWREEKRGKE